MVVVCVVHAMFRENKIIFYMYNQGCKYALYSITCNTSFND